MNTPTNLHKLTVISQILDELLVQTLATQNKIIKAAGEEDLRYMLLNRYPLRLNQMPDTMSALIREVEGFCLTSRELLSKSKKLNYIHTYIHTMTHVTAEDEAALNEVMQMLEAQPLETTSAAALVPFTDNDQIPAQREKLAVLVSTAKSKVAIGVQLTHDQIKRLSDKNVQKYSKRYEAYIGNKTTDSLIDSANMLFSRKNSRMTTSLTRSFHPLLKALHFDAVDGWRWPMLPLSLQNKSTSKGA